MNSPLQRIVVFPLINLLSTLRHMRNMRDALKKDLQDLKDRQKSGHDGSHNAAILALDAELMIVEDSVKILWTAWNTPPVSPAPTSP